VKRKKNVGAGSVDFTCSGPKRNGRKKTDANGETAKGGGKILEGKRSGGLGITIYQNKKQMKRIVVGEGIKYTD